MHFESEQWRYLAPFQQYPCVVLERGKPWNDFGHVTRFTAWFYPEPGRHILLGFVKILQRGQMRTELPRVFTRLDEDFCSLGQDMGFYDRVHDLGPALAREILEGLRDVALSPSHREAFENERGYSRSLLRSSSAILALRGARSLFGTPAGEEAVPSSAGAPQPPSFSYRVLLDDFDLMHELDIGFQVRDEWLGRMVALVGRNGTGKTVLMAKLAHALSGFLSEEENTGLSPAKPPVSQVITISYSPFDTFIRPRHQPGVSYVYCGLRDPGDKVDLRWALSEFDDALESLYEQGRWGIWRRLLEESGILEELPSSTNVAEYPGKLSKWIQQQSSGHKVVLLILTKVFASIQRRSILLFDEPETHLHPHLLSALMRLLHLLLHEYDSYAIVATHSPIVLQELPARDIRIIEREGNIPFVTRYPGESFGENLTEIINTAFRVDEKSKNYFHILRQLVNEKSNRDDVAALFDRRLNLNVRMALHALTTDSEAQDDDEP
ncbi:MAG TPA: AAA family ATPase [Archangium sp.]|nr:AAA family ATPase [Archangium sp.]